MEITLAALADALTADYNEVGEVYAHDAEARTFKTSEEDGTEAFWTYTADPVRGVQTVTYITYWEFCDLNGDSPDFG